MKSSSDKLWTLTTLIVLAAMLVGMLWCKARIANQSIAATGLGVVVAKACTDFGRCPLKVILLRGEVIAGSEVSVLAKVSAIRDKSPELRTVCFNSVGGDNTAGIAISRYISEQGLDTCLARIYETLDEVWQEHDAYCHSVCPWMVMGGKERIVFSKNITVGFHGSTQYWKFCGCEIFRVENYKAKDGFALLLRHNSDDHRETPANLTKHLALLDWSFEQGFSSTTTRRTVRKLLDEDNFFTRDLSQS